MKVKQGKALWAMKAANGSGRNSVTQLAKTRRTSQRPDHSVGQSFCSACRSRIKADCWLEALVTSRFP